MNRGAKHVPFRVPQELQVRIAVLKTDSNTSQTGAFRQAGTKVRGEERCRTRTLTRRPKEGHKEGNAIVIVEAGGRKHPAVMYRANDVFVVASHYKALDTLALKAMVAGTPVVSHHGRLSEAVSDAVLFVDPAAASLAGALQRTISDGLTRAESSRAFRFKPSASFKRQSEIFGRGCTRGAPGVQET